MFVHGLEVRHDAVDLRQVLLHRGDARVRLEVLLRELDVERDDDELALRLLGLPLELGRLEEARQMFLQAIAVSPSSVVYYNLSGTQAAMGQLREAVESARTAIRLRPDFAEARIKLGVYLIALGSYRESIETLKQVSENNPDDERAYLTRLTADLRAAIRKGESVKAAASEAAAGERDKWRLFEDYNARNATAGFAELEWEGP